MILMQFILSGKHGKMFASILFNYLFRVHKVQPHG